MKKTLLYVYLSFYINLICFIYCDKNCKYITETISDSTKSLIESMNGLVLSSLDDSKNNVYYFGICTNPLSQLKMDRLENSGMIQYSNDTKAYTSIGKYTATTAKYGANWLLLEYRDGEKYDSHCGLSARRAFIMITCPPADSSYLHSPLRVLEEYKLQAATSECYYLFEMEHKAVCKSVNVPKSGQGASVLFILFLILFSVIAIYLGVGMLYKRVVFGYKGLYAIPNALFWKRVGNNFADVTDVVCRCRTCCIGGNGAGFSRLPINSGDHFVSSDPSDLVVTQDNGGFPSPHAAGVAPPALVLMNNNNNGSGDHSRQPAGSHSAVGGLSIAPSAYSQLPSTVSELRRSSYSDEEDFDRDDKLLHL